MRMAKGRQYADGSGINATVLVCLDLVLPRFTGFRDTAGIVQLAAQVLAAIDDKRVFAMSISQQAKLGVAGLGGIGWLLGMKDGAIDAWHAIFV